MSTNAINIFKAFDYGDFATIDESEFTNAIACLEMNISKTTCSLLFKQLDTDGDHKVTKQEFLDLCEIRYLEFNELIIKHKKVN